MEDSVTEVEKKLVFPPNNSLGGTYEGDEDQSFKRQKKDEEKTELKEEDKEGGFLNNIISNLVSPKAGADNEGKNGVVDVEDDGGSATSSVGGGIMNKISNIFHHGEEENGEVKGENEGGGGGSIIDNIVSHLPARLTDDAVPESDEAAILIHSIIHD